MKRILLLSIVLILSMQCIAQIGMTKSEIIKEYGYDYESEYIKDYVYYVKYIREVQSTIGGNVLLLKAFYFNDYNDVCYEWAVITFNSELEYVINYYDRIYTRIGKLKWKDYSDNTIFEISVDEKLFTIKVSKKNKI